MAVPLVVGFDGVRGEPRGGGLCRHRCLRLGAAGSAVRLDSGGLGALALRARALLDVAGLQDVRIVAGGGLAEYGVEELVRSGAPIDVYAPDTRT